MNYLIDHKCNETVKWYPNRMYSKERRPQFKYGTKITQFRKSENNVLLHLIEIAPPSNNLVSLSAKINKHRGALSKNAISNVFCPERGRSFFSLFPIFFTLLIECCLYKLLPSPGISWSSQVKY